MTQPTSPTTVLLTGVSSGIGHALAARLLADGHTVLGVSRRRPEQLARNERFRFHALDLADASAIGPALTALVPAGATLGLVILNAGVLGEIRDLVETPLTDMRQVMDVNVWSNKLVLEALWARGVATPQVVAISSGAGIKGHRGWGAYAVSKAALNMLMMVYATERPDVHFTALAPGLVDTAMQEYIRTLPDTPRFASLDRLKAAHGTDAMPTAEACAGRLVSLFPRLLSQPSGSYLDVRNLS